jgi:hypothetical protein
VKPAGKRLKLDEAVDDEDLQSAISAIVALEHSEAVSTLFSTIWLLCCLFDTFPISILYSTVMKMCQRQKELDYVLQKMTTFHYP